ncbi:glycosyltransferase family 4 protein [Micromonospora sp. D93]|uniref:glycosyltransferase family 4 protein n=1 Tax=Micromonospora sp. D93 TaxID=2824886 RepID=UPI001B3813D9|nr:glycosyltransferase family 4 protein [Micromonospora sp. D93]MBQ1017967.1 glycosyltransferase family 4 protein [Micromonospora sp. D93]
MNHSAKKPAVLALNCAWPALKGGIPAFNRNLLAAFAGAGHRTACLVEAPTRDDIEDAAAHGVDLFAAERSPAGPSMMLESPAARLFEPDVVIGHDRFTGPSAWVQRRRYLRDASLVHIVHTAPAEIERFKGGLDATERAEERERIIRMVTADADVVAAVGPRLQRYTADLVEDGSGRVRVVQLDPGLGPLHLGRRQPPPKKQVLVLGRTDDLELKGLDLAARAIAAVPGADAASLGLLVRGAPRGECDALHRTLVGLSGVARERIDVRPFTTDPDELRRDLLRSLVCVMPSRVEGFGLVALDAIAAGTPLLVSAKSGAAELLRDRLGRLAEPMLVDIADEPDTDVLCWSAAVARVLAEPEAALRHAEEVRQRLTPHLTWQHTVTAILDAVAYAPTPRPYGGARRRQ